MSLSKITSTTTPKHPRFHLPKLWKDLERRGEEPELPLLSLPSLNKKIWGLSKQELTVIGGRTSQGKSSLVLQIAWDLACQGKSVVYLSLEMTVGALLERLFCHSEEIDNIKLLVGHFKNYPIQKDNFEKKMADIPLLITEGIGKNWQEIDEFISLINPKPDVIILDYIQCIQKRGVERTVIDEYIYHFREEAIRNDFAAVIVSQINRSTITNQDNKEKTPTLEGLKSSGYLEEISDKVILLHYPYFYNQGADPDKYRILVSKNRNGRVGSFTVNFDAPFYKFRDIVLHPEAEKVRTMFGGYYKED